MNKIWAMLSVAVVLVSIVSCSKQKVAIEAGAPVEIRSSESVQSADKTEIARLRGLLEAAGKEFASLRENGNTLIQANQGLATELLAVKEALKVKEGEIGIFSRDLKRALETGGKTKRALMAKIFALNKEKEDFIASQSSLSEKLRAAEGREKQMGDELARQKALYAKEIKEWGERLNKKDIELMKVQEDAFWQKVGALALVCLLLLFLFVGLYLRTCATTIKPQPVA